MPKILITAYDVDPYQGSESGFGWNFIFQASRFNKVVAVTRQNNRRNIERFMTENNIGCDNLEFQYFDLPYYLRFWKSGARGALAYFYIWQFSLALVYRWKKLDVDIVHGLNFSSDSIPTFLWLLNKPLVWGPINHHEVIKLSYIARYGFWSVFRDRLVWAVKLLEWNLDPFLYLSKRKSDVVLCGNKSVIKRLKLAKKKSIIFQSSGTVETKWQREEKGKNFVLILPARFTPLKGVDIALNAFKLFLEKIGSSNNVKLILIGRGPSEDYLRNVARELDIQGSVRFENWVSKDELKKYFLQASAMVYPSHEGAGMVVVEALSLGLPIICFDNYGPGEMVDSSCGKKIPYSTFQKSIEDFSLALHEIYCDGDLLQSLSVGAYEKANAHYTWGVKGEQLRKVYANLILAK
ncbi:hypothetical protein NBRC116493_17810 [Aurantivibrio infirmus]